MEPGLSSSTSSVASSIGQDNKNTTAECTRGLDLDAWLSAWPNVHAQFRFLVTSLQRRKVHGSLQCAKMTIEVLKCVRACMPRRLGGCCWVGRDGNALHWGWWWWWWWWWYPIG